MSNNNGLDLQQQILASLGFAVKLEWLDDMLPQLEAAHAGAFQQMSRDQQIQLILEQLLMADLRMAGAGGHLPAGVKVGVLCNRGSILGTVSNCQRLLLSFSPKQ